MSGNFPSLRPEEGPPRRVEGPKQSLLHTNGCETAMRQTGRRHPLEQSERNYVKNQEEINLQMLRNLQGLHAPFRLRTERALASRVGRLAPLQSSNLMLDVVTGLDGALGFQDVLGGCEFIEVAEESSSEGYLAKGSQKI